MKREQQQQSIDEEAIKTTTTNMIAATTIVGYYYKKRARVRDIIDFVYPPKNVCGFISEATIMTRTTRY